MFNFGAPRFKVEGVPDMVKRFNALDAALQRDLVVFSIAVGAKIFEDGAKARAKRVSGKMAESISTKIQAKGPTGPRAQVKPMAFYARFLEFGTKGDYTITANKKFAVLSSTNPDRKRIDFITDDVTVDIRRQQYLHFWNRKSGEEVFARSVTHPGIKPGTVAFMRPTWDADADRAKSAIVTTLKTLVENGPWIKT